MPDTSLAAVSRALVVGLGRSGAAVSTALADVGIAVVAVDARPDAEVPAQLRDRVEVHTGIDAEAIAGLVDGVSLVVPSPGVSEHAPVIGRARAAGTPVWSEPEVGYHLAPRELVGVTGTNGKTTVTELAAAMLAGLDRPVIACGNIGNVFTTAAVRSSVDALLVAELSSFQLRFAHELRPAIGVLLNVSPDHLDWHADVSSYEAAKARLWRAQGADDWAVGNADEARSAELVRRHAPGQVAWVSCETVPEIGAGLVEGRLVTALPSFAGVLLRTDELPISAPHHVSNVAAAATAGLLAGAHPDDVAEAARRYRPGRHRLELVAEREGVRFVDDSKATNPHAAAAALRSVSGSGSGGVVWIAGGLAKGADFGPLGEELTGVRHAVLLGSAAAQLAELAAAHDVPATRTETIEDAVRTALVHAEAGDTVLLAPACASFDQFADYAERGERFAAAVRSLGAHNAAAEPTGPPREVSGA